MGKSKISFKELIGYALNPGDDDDDDDPLDDVLFLSKFRDQDLEEDEDEDEDEEDEYIDISSDVVVSAKDEESFRKEYTGNMKLAHQAFERFADATPGKMTADELATTVLVAHTHLILARALYAGSEKEEQEAERGVRVVHGVLSRLAASAGFND